MSNNTFYFVSGASGSGKTAICADLQQILGNDVAVYDFDSIGVPQDAGKQWRQQASEEWLQRLLKEGKDACLLGQMVLGEILACPSAKHLGKIHFCLLDVSDYERIQRLKNRNTYGIDQNMLNWSSWLRMHHQDPQWMPQVIQENCWDQLDFHRWEHITAWSSLALVKNLDTTTLSIPQVAKSLVQWINSQKGERIANTAYTLHKNLDNTFALIDERLFAYNKQCVPATQTPEVIDIHYVVKENDTIIGGICADMYIWKILFISLLFVEQTHRHKNLATLLIKRVEEEAQALGATLIHLDTFDFQAKDFYLKQGYEIFGTLEDCPPGHKRYYLKKDL